MTKGILWIVLYEVAKEKVFELVPPLYPKIFADHVTLFYNVELNDKMESLVGQQVNVELKANCHNNHIQAVAVEIGNLPCQNPFPHITLSAQKGVKPFTSNIMLQGVHSSQSLKGSLQGVVEFEEFK